MFVDQPRCFLRPIFVIGPSPGMLRGMIARVALGVSPNGARVGECVSECEQFSVQPAAELAVA